MNIKKGDILYADLTPVIGSEQGGVRPVLIIQNNIGNRYSPTVIVAAITSRTGKPPLPTHGMYSTVSCAQSCHPAGLTGRCLLLLHQED